MVAILVVLAISIRQFSLEEERILPVSCSITMEADCVFLKTETFLSFGMDFLMEKGEMQRKVRIKKRMRLAFSTFFFPYFTDKFRCAVN